LTVNKNNPH